MDLCDIAALLRDVAAGKLSPEQAAALINPPPKKRGRPKKVTRRIGFRQPDGSTWCPPPPKHQRKLTRRAIAVGKFYTGLLAQGHPAKEVMWRTLKRFHKPKQPLGERAVFHYVRSYRQSLERAGRYCETQRRMVNVIPDLHRAAWEAFRHPLPDIKAQIKAIEAQYLPSPDTFTRQVTRNEK